MKLIKTDTIVSCTQKRWGYYTWCIIISVLGILGCAEPQKTEDTLDTPEEVLQETIAVFTMISAQIHTGKKELIYLRELEKTKEKLIK